MLTLRLKYKKVTYLFLLGGFLLVGLLACAGENSSVEQIISLKINSSKNANQGEPFYIAIYSTNREQFLTTSYFDITNQIFKNNKSKNLLSFQLILPGEEKDISLTTQNNTSLGIYALFTHPSEQWKLLLIKPLKSKYKIILKGNSIFLKKEDEHWWNKMIF